MKRFVIYLLSSILLCVGFSSCQREIIGGGDKPLEFASFTVNLGQDVAGQDSDVATKSIIEFDAENYKCAMLYAFYYDNGTLVCDYKQAPGKSFTWDLPLRTEMDIYCLYNYGNLSVPDGEMYTPAGTRNALDNLMFNYSGQMTAFNATGLPKAGITHVTSSQLQSANDVLTIKVKNLFAKFNIRINASNILESGDSWNVTSVRVYNMNNSVHYFSPSGGDAATSLASTYTDYATSADLVQFNAQNYITLYVLENMQGNKETGKDSWFQTYRYGLETGQLSTCTYASITVDITHGGAPKASYTAYAYLNNEDAEFPSKTHFNIVRNRNRSYEIQMTDSGASIVFDDLLYNARINAPLDLPFTYQNVDWNHLTFEFSNPGYILSYSASRVSGSQYAGRGILHVSGFSASAPLGRYNVIAREGTARANTNFDLGQYKVIVTGPTNGEVNANETFSATARLYMDSGAGLTEVTTYPGHFEWRVNGDNEYLVAQNAQYAGYAPVTDSDGWVRYNENASAQMWFKATRSDYYGINGNLNPANVYGDSEIEVRYVEDGCSPVGDWFDIQVKPKYVTVYVDLQYVNDETYAFVSFSDNSASIPFPMTVNVYYYNTNHYHQFTIPEGNYRSDVYVFEQVYTGITSVEVNGWTYVDGEQVYLKDRNGSPVDTIYIFSFEK